MADGIIHVTTAARQNTQNVMRLSQRPQAFCICRVRYQLPCVMCQLPGLVEQTSAMSDKAPVRINAGERARSCWSVGPTKRGHGAIKVRLRLLPFPTARIHITNLMLQARAGL